MFCFYYYYYLSLSLTISFSFYTSSGQKQSATFQNVHTSLGRVHVSTQSLMDEVSKMCLADLLYVSCVILSKLLENVTHD